jgi:hypothetical protein
MRNDPSFGGVLELRGVQSSFSRSRRVLIVIVLGRYFRQGGEWIRSTGGIASLLLAIQVNG